MPQASNIVLADAQATPVNHTFIPIGRDSKGVFWYEDQSVANAIGYWRISVETKRPDFSGAVATGVYRTRVGLHEPVLETLGTNDAGLTPPPTVAYISRAFGEFIDSPRSILQNRKDMVKMFSNLIAETANIEPVLQDHEELSF